MGFKVSNIISDGDGDTRQQQQKIIPQKNIKKNIFKIDNPDQN